jgi:serine/threonine protein kinase
MNGPEPGLEILPGLTLLRRLGRGGMGEAWLARDAERGEQVVAKLLPGDAPPERKALLRREARLVRKLKHPRIVPVYGFHAGERFCAVTLRHMPGGDASARRGATPAEIVRLGRDVADALAYLHDVGVVHRDVKATNVLLDDAGRAHLADFGIASVAQGDEDGIVVRGGGTRVSMSPQQLAGAPPAPTDDLYALGVLLLELLSGETRVAREAGDAGPPPRLPEALQLPERLRGLVASLLAASPEARPASAAAVRDELDLALAEITRGVAQRDQQAVRLQPPPRVLGNAEAPERNGRLPNLLPDRRDAPAASLRMWIVGGLVLLAAGAVVWLPRWAEAPPPVSPAASPGVPLPSPAPASAARPAEAAPAVPTPRPPAESPAPESAPRAEAPEPPQPRAGNATRARGDEPAPLGQPVPQPEPTPDLEAEGRALEAHREEGARLEAREDWRGALQQYAAALAIDSHVTFAIEGRERAQKRAALGEALAFHAQRPDRLGAPAVAREAEALLERARGAQPAGPALQAQIAAVEKALALARTPVAVVIESDGLTELSVSRVGPLGPLKRRSLELLPGTYTVTGSRSGYRDVRRQFSVAPGAPAPTVSLRCDEAL